MYYLLIIQEELRRNNFHIPTLKTLFEAVWIIAGLWMLSKLAWMNIYEFRKKGDGEKYFRGEIKKCKRKKEMNTRNSILLKILKFMKSIKKL